MSWNKWIKLWLLRHKLVLKTKTKNYRKYFCTDRLEYTIKNCFWHINLHAVSKSLQSGLVGVCVECLGPRFTTSWCRVTKTPRYWGRMCSGRCSGPRPQSSCNSRCWVILAQSASLLRGGCMRSSCCRRGCCSCWKLDSCYKWNGWWGPCCRTGCRRPRPPPGKASHPAPALAQTPCVAVAETPSPGSGPAFAACTCTSGSGTRFSLGSASAWARRPGGLSPGRRGTSAAWSGAPAHTPAPARTGPAASCVCGAWVGPDHRAWCPPRVRPKHWNLLLKAIADKMCYLKSPSLGLSPGQQPNHFCSWFN